ncbi:MAG: PAS domain S-box protein [Deltaproteobacteria bacterium]|nr:PAS domain S-box protein [Deltaproteobacteria bacterium]
MSSLHRVSLFHGIGQRLLIWFSLFFLIPLVTVGYTGYRQSKAAIQHQVFEHFESLLNLQRDALTNYLRQKEIQLKTTVTDNEFLFIAAVVLQSTTFSDESIRNTRARLQKYLKEKNHEFGSKLLWITGKDGRVLASSDPALMGMDRSQAPESVQYRNHPAPVFSTYMEGNHHPEIVVSSPIKSGNGGFLGLFNLVIPMEAINRILKNRTGLGRTGETFLVNKAGFIISNSRFQKEVILKKKVNLKEMYQREGWIRSHAYVRDYRGAQVIQHFLPFPRFGWTLVAEMETAEAFREINVQLHRTLLIGLGLFSLLIFAALLITRNLTRPIHALVDAARRVGGGDLNFQVADTSDDELAELAYEFNRMTDNLKASKKKMEEWNASIQEEVHHRTQELIKSEMKFHKLIEKANDAIFIFNAETRLCTLANLKAETLTGFSQKELRETTYTDLFLVEDRERVEDNYTEALKEGASNLYKIPLRRKDERYVFVDISNSLFDFQNQKFINAIFHDVTEQRKIDREREVVFEISDTIAKSSDLSQILSGALENILYNLELGMAAIFLYEAETEELVLARAAGFSETFQKDFARLSLQAPDSIATTAARARSIQIIDHPYRDAMSRYVGSRTNPDDLQSDFCLPLIAEGTLTGVLELVTNRKRGFSGEDLILLEALANQLAAGIFRIRLEAGKHQDDQFLAGILTDSVDGIISMDAEDRITTWNSGAEKIFHFSKEEVLGTPFPALFREAGQVYPDPVRQELREKGFIRDYEINNITREGREVTLHISLTAIRDQRRQMIGSSAVIRDITEQKQIQEQIQRSEKLSSIGQLAAGIAHEIGTPLNIISGNAEYLMMDMDPDNPLTEELSIILQQTDRITQLIQQLMDFARDNRPRFEPTDINALVLQTLNLTRHQMEKNAIILLEDLDEEVPPTVADAHQLQQVLLNIIINALHAMPEGGTLQIRTARDEERQQVIIRIRDNGCGIHPQDLKNIFNPFFTTKEVGQGTGLGLAVCHRIMENHQGRIEVESRLGEGSCFSLLLPFRRTGEENPARDGAIASRKNQKKWSPK